MKTVSVFPIRKIGSALMVIRFLSFSLLGIKILILGHPKILSNHCEIGLGEECPRFRFRPLADIILFGSIYLNRFSKTLLMNQCCEVPLNASDFRAQKRDIRMRGDDGSSAHLSRLCYGALTKSS